MKKMADPTYGSDYYLDTEVKQEQMLDGSNMYSASVPIPARRPTELSDLRDFNLEFELCGQEGMSSIYQTISHPSIYNKFNIDMDSNSKCETFKMDDDDIFQVDKADLIQGPTLAELNANDNTLLEDLNFDDLLLPEENSYYLHIGGSMMQALKSSPPALEVNAPVTPQPSPVSYNYQGNYRDTDTCSPLDGYGRGHTGAFSPVSGHSSSVHSSQHGSPCLGLQELLSSPNLPPTQLPPQHRSLAAARLSSSAPTHLSLEQIWARREPRKHLLSTGSLAEAGSTSSLSTGGVLSPQAPDDLSQDEDSEEDDSDRYEDFSSDADDADDDPDGKTGSKVRRMSKKERFFWQYNVQAKGPKGQRLVLKTKLEDPHVLNEVTDPVFSPSCSVRGIKHSGKARKGDGNDLTPNPKKLFMIGKELDGLGRVINDMTPVSELPFNVQPKTRKEKNKLASRACRLKKKAQHEANKLKLYGLEHEHKRLINGISHLKGVITRKVTSPKKAQEYETHIEKIVKSATKVKIAGHSSEFVNRVLEKVKVGVPDGGLNDF